MLVDVKNTIRRLANVFGVDLVRLDQSPRHSFLGLGEKNFQNIIDCGANEGQFARSTTKIFPSANFYCFEPLPEPFGKLLAWAGTQNGRVHCFNVALGNEEGEVEMHHHYGHTPSSSLLAATTHCHQLYPQTAEERMTTVRLTTLDKALQSYLPNMHGAALLKLDVQGFEDRVLQGAGNVLEVCSACVLEVSIDPLYDGQADFFELTRHLKQFGYRYSGNLDQVHSDNGRAVYVDAVFLKDESL